MLQRERAAAASQRSRHALDGDVACGGGDRRARRQHLPPARRFEVAVELLVEDESAQRGVLGGVVCRRWRHADLKRPARMLYHRKLLLTVTAYVRTPGHHSIDLSAFSSIWECLTRLGVV